MHGKLAVTVADTGLGFGAPTTAGTGVGLANIRERLKLLYGDKASMVVADNPPERHGRDASPCPTRRCSAKETARDRSRWQPRRAGRSLLVLLTARRRRR